MIPDSSRGFVAPCLAADILTGLGQTARRARADVVRMIAAAESGHLGGSLSSLDIYLMLFAGAQIGADRSDGDRIVVSHGHTAAGLYAALAHAGLILRDEVIASFRRCGSVFEGHPGVGVPGVDWASGNLGQGLSVACGIALAARYTARRYHVYCVLGDGEHQKGQIAEAQRFAATYGLSGLTAVVDCNGLQATGRTRDIMPQDLAAEYETHGWRVLDADGHDFASLYAALHACRGHDGPSVVLARTVMGKGVSCAENDHRYHGTVPSAEQIALALRELEAEGVADTEEGGPVRTPSARKTLPYPVIGPSTARTYALGEHVENRTACGAALADVVAANPHAPIVALDCDLGPSVKLDALRAVAPERLIQCGISEHHAASLAGGLSRAGVVPVFADFGVFALGETYNQQRLNDMNHTAVKLIATHCGLDVGEDGKTHQCIDAVGLLANLYGWKLVIPADANQADRVVRWMVAAPGNIAVAVGRSKLPILTDEEGRARFGEGYTFDYGAADWIRRGAAGTIVTCGTMTHRALAAADSLKREGLVVGVLNVSCPLALDEAALRRAAASGVVVTYEDHHVRTGLGALVSTFLAEAGIVCRFRRLGTTRYGGSGCPDDLYRDQCLDEDSLARTVRALVKEQQ